MPKDLVGCQGIRWVKRLSQPKVVVVGGGLGSRCLMMFFLKRVFTTEKFLGIEV